MLGAEDFRARVLLLGLGLGGCDYLLRRSAGTNNMACTVPELDYSNAWDTKSLEKGRGYKHLKPSSHSHPLFGRARPLPQHGDLRLVLGPHVPLHRDDSVLLGDGQSLRCLPRLPEVLPQTFLPLDSRVELRFRGGYRLGAGTLGVFELAF